MQQDTYTQSLASVQVMQPRALGILEKAIQQQLLVTQAAGKSV
jgi:hypothetical protein